MELVIDEISLNVNTQRRDHVMNVSDRYIMFLHIGNMFLQLPQTEYCNFSVIKVKLGELTLAALTRFESSQVGRGWRCYS